jgi:hypothetical protein
VSAASFTDHVAAITSAGSGNRRPCRAGSGRNPARRRIRRCVRSGIKSESTARAKQPVGRTPQLHQSIRHVREVGGWSSGVGPVAAEAPSHFGAVVESRREWRSRGGQGGVPVAEAKDVAKSTVNVGRPTLVGVDAGGWC